MSRYIDSYRFFWPAKVKAITPSQDLRGAGMVSFSGPTYSQNLQICDSKFREEAKNSTSSYKLQGLCHAAVV